MRLILSVILIAALSSMCFAEYIEDTEYKIEILEDGIIQVRRSDIVFKDGVEISRKYHRHILAPGESTTNEIQKVKDIATVVWTPDVISAYNEKIKSIKSK